jgi:hypothetical protein
MADRCDNTDSKKGKGETPNGLDLVGLTCRPEDPRFLRVAQATDPGPVPIGNATEIEDGTIVLHMSNRSGVDLYKGISYKKDNPVHNRLASHLEIKPGETKPILPFSSDGPYGEGSNVIGTAKINEAGAITITTKESKADHYASETFTYPRDHRYYSTVLNHLPGIKPGQTKDLVAWND